MSIRRVSNHLPKALEQQQENVWKMMWRWRLVQRRCRASSWKTVQPDGLELFRD
jgi:hypothetical protein